MGTVGQEVHQEVPKTLTSSPFSSSSSFFLLLTMVLSVLADSILICRIACGLLSIAAELARACSLSLWPSPGRWLRNLCLRARLTRGHDQARSRADESSGGSREASRESDLIMAGYESSLITAGASSSQGSGGSFKRRQAAIYCLDDHALHQLISLSRTCYDDERY